MSLGFIFWLLMLLWALGRFANRWAPQPWGPVVDDVFLFILFFIVGWKVFGFAITA